MSDTHDDMPDDGGLVREVARCLQRARRLLVITGAGVSADSGLPTYRGIGGLYERGVTEDGIPIEQALSGEMMRRSPELTWKYIGQIETACRGAQPNAAHRALVDLESVCETTWLLTQNVDGFHRQAGSRDVVEMHGNLHDLHCVSCDYETWVADYSGLRTLPPLCPECGELVRPRVVLFGELLPATALDRYYAILDQGMDLVISVGTTALFPYIAAPVFEAARAGIPTVEINPGESELSTLVDYRIDARAAVALPEIARRAGAAA